MKIAPYLYSLALLVSSSPLLPAAEQLRQPVREDRVAPIAAREQITRGDYVLQPLDVLRVHVFQEDDLNKQMEQVSISGEYTVNLPLVKTINLRGKTLRQTEELIRAAYDKDYIVNPQVTVSVVKYAERSVSIIGQVTNPGRIQFPQERGLTIVEAISAAGGPTRLADLKKVRLQRTRPDGEAEVREVNVDAMTKSSGREAVLLEKDDVVLVPERII